MIPSKKVDNLDRFNQLLNERSASIIRRESLSSRIHEYVSSWFLPLLVVGATVFCTVLACNNLTIESLGKDISNSNYAFSCIFISTALLGFIINLVCNKLIKDKEEIESQARMQALESMKGFDRTEEGWVQLNGFDISLSLIDTRMDGERKTFTAKNQEREKRYSDGKMITGATLLIELVAIAVIFGMIYSGHFLRDQIGNTLTSAVVMALPLSVLTVITGLGSIISKASKDKGHEMWHHGFKAAIMASITILGTLLAANYLPMAFPNEHESGALVASFALAGAGIGAIVVFSDKESHYWEFIKPLALLILTIVGTTFLATHRGGLGLTDISSGGSVGILCTMGAGMTLISLINTIEKKNHWKWLIPLAMIGATILGTIILSEYLSQTAMTQTALNTTCATWQLVGVAATIGMIKHLKLRENEEHLSVTIPEKFSDIQFRERYRDKVLCEDTKQYVYSWLIPMLLALLVISYATTMSHEYCPEKAMPYVCVLSALGGFAAASVYHGMREATRKERSVLIQEVKEELTLEKASAIGR